MKRSTDRILATHVGSLIRPPQLQELLRAKQKGNGFDECAFAEALTRSVAEVVRRQAECGIDVVNDGEVDFGAWWSYVYDRLARFELRQE